MKKTVISLLFALSVCVVLIICYAETPENNNYEQQIQQLQEKVEHQQEIIGELQRLVNSVHTDTVVENANRQINFLMWVVGILGVLITIFGVFVPIYTGLRTTILWTKQKSVERLINEHKNQMSSLYLNLGLLEQNYDVGFRYNNAVDFFRESLKYDEKNESTYYYAMKAYFSFPAWQGNQTDNADNLITEGLTKIKHSALLYAAKSQIAIRRKNIIDYFKYYSFFLKYRKDDEQPLNMDAEKAFFDNFYYVDEEVRKMIKNRYNYIKQYLVEFDKYYSKEFLSVENGFYSKLDAYINVE